MKRMGIAAILVLGAFALHADPSASVGDYRVLVAKSVITAHDEITTPVSSVTYTAHVRVDQLWAGLGISYGGEYLYLTVTSAGCSTCRGAAIVTLGNAPLPTDGDGNIELTAMITDTSGGGTPVSGTITLGFEAGIVSQDNTAGASTFDLTGALKSISTGEGRSDPGSTRLAGPAYGSVQTDYAGAHDLELAVFFSGTEAGHPFAGWYDCSSSGSPMIECRTSLLDPPRTQAGVASETFTGPATLLLVEGQQGAWLLKGTLTSGETLTCGGPMSANQADPWVPPSYLLEGACTIE